MGFDLFGEFENKNSWKKQKGLYFMIKSLKRKKDGYFLVYSSLRQEGTMMEKDIGKNSEVEKNDLV